MHTTLGQKQMITLPKIYSVNSSWLVVVTTKNKTAQREPGSDARQGLTAGNDDYLIKNIHNKLKTSSGDPS